MSDPAMPAPLGSYVTGSAISSLFVDGNQVYLGDNESHSEASLRVLDVSNPAQPVTLALEQISVGAAIWAANNKAYAGIYSSVSVLDLSQPGSIRVLSHLELGPGSGEVRGIQAVGQILYVVAGDFGNPSSGRLAIYDVNNASRPLRLGMLGFKNVPLDIKVVGDYAYLALADAGLAVVDVRNPHEPARVGSGDTPAVAFRVEFAGSNAFVADYHGGLQVIDVRDPGRLAAMASFDTGATARMVRVRGDKAYLLSSDWLSAPFPNALPHSRLEVLGLSDPERPILLGTYQADRAVGALEVADDVAYLGWTRGETSGLQIVDFRAPLQPGGLLTDLTNRAPASQPYVSVSGHYAYVATTESRPQSSATRLQILDARWKLAGRARLGGNQQPHSAAGRRGRVLSAEQALNSPVRFERVKPLSPSTSCEKNAIHPPVANGHNLRTGTVSFSGAAFGGHVVAGPGARDCATALAGWAAAIPGSTRRSVAVVRLALG